MALDKFEYLPGIIHELQDGGLQISETSAAPKVLVLGTASKGVASLKKQVVRAQESENEFGKEGTLVRGMYEALAGGSSNTFLYRLNAKSATLTGVGTDDQSSSPTFIETLIKDGSAADLYSIYYRTPATLGPNFTEGRLQVENALGVLVYDNNPGGTPIDLGEVIVSGTFDAGVDIGTASVFVTLRDVAQEEVAVTAEATGASYGGGTAETTDFTVPAGAALSGGEYFTFSSPVKDYYMFCTVDGVGTDPLVASRTAVQVDLLGADSATQVATKVAAAFDGIESGVVFDGSSAVAVVTALNLYNGNTTDVADGDFGITGITATDGTDNGPEANIALGNDFVNEASLKVYIGGTEVASSFITLNSVTNPDQFTIAAGSILTGAVTVDYTYDADSKHELDDGSDGLNPSRMELYEALEDAYRSLENDEVDIVLPMNVFLDDKNVADGDTLALTASVENPVGRRYPVPGAAGDGLGELYIEEYEGAFYYFWDIDNDGQAEIYPAGVGSASATTGIDGTSLTAADFHEVNFAYQLANFCFSLSVNDNECTGVVGTLGPASYSAKDVSNWIGKEPTFDALGDVSADGSGLLGNKFMAGTLSRDAGFYATDDGFLPTSGDFDSDASILEDRNGHKIDIGKYISVVAMPLTFFNATDDTGFGYQASMASYYGGFYSALPVASAPTNKVVSGARAPFRVSKTKLNSLAKYKYIAIKQKENRLRISDSPTAARDDSDFTRLTTMRIIADAIDSVRAVAEPYIGEGNTALARVSLETGIVRELSQKQELGNIQRFEARVSATSTQQIQGDSTVELTIVPAFELRKITIITSLAKQ
jgi:hypothetical protein